MPTCRPVPALPIYLPTPSGARENRKIQKQKTNKPERHPPVLTDRRVSRTPKQECQAFFQRSTPTHTLHTLTSIISSKDEGGESQHTRHTNAVKKSWYE